MHIDVLTLFPDYFVKPFSEGIFGRAAENGIISIATHDIRDYTEDRHRTADDYPYGGGPGMVLKPEPVFKALEAVKQGMSSGERKAVPLILLTPQGRPLQQAAARELAENNRLVLICGHYEGVDERIREHMITDEISIGDYVLSGGELPAMVLMDAVLRLVPGVLGSADSLTDESHNSGLLEYPQYTRPADFQGWQVPPVLLSGNHGEVARWRREQVIRRTARRRPDLIEKTELTEKEQRLAADSAVPKA